MKRIVIIALAIVLIGGVLAYRMYNKPHTDVASAEVAEELSAEALFQRFIADEQLANTELVERVIVVKGRVSEVDRSNDVEWQLVLQTSDDQGFVRCGLDEGAREKAEGISAGDQITLRGICKGVNFDEALDLLADTEVILSKCMIIE